jgi:hypothetical protein
MNGSRRRRQTDTSRILVGYWRESTEPEPNQHAVYGILSRDGKLRFKVVAETREGDHISGPLNPGDSWIVYDEVGLEPHLEGLNRLEMKEYCRVREHQLGQGENKEDSAANRLKAVDLAKEIAEAAYGHERPRNLRWAREKCADERRAQRKLKKKNSAAAAAASQLEQMRNGVPQPQHSPPAASPQQHVFSARPDSSQPASSVITHARTPSSSSVDVKQQRPLPDVVPPRSHLDIVKPRAQSDEIKRHSLPGVAKLIGDAKPRTPLRDDPVLDRSDGATIHVDGDVRLRSSTASDSPNPPPPEADSAKTWHNAMQPVVGTMGGPKGDVKSYGGITYKWKEGGLFSRMYVSPGSIITIDKEDYVEYRILTTP